MATITRVYDTYSHAQQAVRDLESSGISSSDISLARPSQRACLSRALFRQRIAGNQSLHEAASAG